MQDRVSERPLEFLRGFMSRVHNWTARPNTQPLVPYLGSGPGTRTPHSVVIRFRAMDFRVYAERNAMRAWLTDLRRRRKIVLVLFPYDGHTPSGVQFATPRP